jgi:hypothetical protein
MPTARSTFVAISTLVVLLPTGLLPASAQMIRPAATSSASMNAAVMMDRDRRHTPEGSRFNATGLVRCGNHMGTAQLVLRPDLIVTAAHVLQDARSGSSCEFLPHMGSGTPIAIRISSIRTGSWNPLAEPATRDWAVARLEEPVPSATPYALASAGTGPQEIHVCAAGNGAPSRFGAESCAIREIIKTGEGGIRELAIDCSAAPGSSGAALLNNAGAVAGIYVGYRSTNPDEPQAFSKTHYNFGITIAGPFRRAVLADAH